MEMQGRLLAKDKENIIDCGSGMSSQTQASEESV